jgi:hypothetical protein
MAENNGLVRACHTIAHLLRHERIPLEGPFGSRFTELIVRCCASQPLSKTGEPFPPKLRLNLSSRPTLDLFALTAFKLPCNAHVGELIRSFPNCVLLVGDLDSRRYTKATFLL